MDLEGKRRLDFGCHCPLRVRTAVKVAVPSVILWQGLKADELLRTASIINLVGKATYPGKRDRTVQGSIPFILVFEN